MNGIEGSAPRRLVGADRVLAVLVELASMPTGGTLDEIAGRLGQNKATVHHALGTLGRARLAVNDARGHYILGDEFLRLAFAHHEARPEDARIQPILRALTTRFGETVHYAVLDGRDIVYRAKLDAPAGAVRLTSTIGGRNPAHCTGVGKLLLSYRLRDLTSVERWVEAQRLERRTAQTITTAAGLHTEFERIRQVGYAVDDRENEDLVNCLAVPLNFGPGGEPRGAVSISALVHRTPLTDLVDAVDEIYTIINRNTRLEAART